jgi:predicted nucleic-acid-binding protein
MQNRDSPRVIQIPVSQVDVLDLVRQLSDENFQLRQAIEEMANTLAVQKELIQQLKDEIAILKGQKKAKTKNFSQ